MHLLLYKHRIKASSFGRLEALNYLKNGTTKHKKTANLSKGGFFFYSEITFPFLSKK
jgi:hypothetical protein